MKSKVSRKKKEKFEFNQKKRKMPYCDECRKLFSKPGHPTQSEWQNFKACRCLDKGFSDRESRFRRYTK